MVEIRRGRAGEGGTDRLPWLEPVEEEPFEEVQSGGGRLAVIGIALLVLIGLIVGGVVMFNRWRAGSADIGEVIRAPVGPYKERPANPGGLKVDASGIIAEKTGTGADIDAPLDLTALPEQPITGPGSERGAVAPIPVAPAAARAPAPAITPLPVPVAPIPAKPVAVAPAPTIKPAAPAPTSVATGGGGSTIQLGAFSSEAKAKSVWKSMAARFGYLAAMESSVVPVKSGDKTLYRLRASGAPAGATCAKLRVAGETCAVAE